METYQIQINETQLDLFGHVNNATYLQLYEQARWEMIEHRGYGVEQIRKTQHGPVILECHIKYRREIKNREKITIKTKCQRDAKNSILMTIEQEMIKESGELASCATFKVGLMDLCERKLIPLTPLWLKAVELGNEGTERH